MDSCGTTTSTKTVCINGDCETVITVTEKECEKNIFEEFLEGRDNEQPTNLAESISETFGEMMGFIGNNIKPFGIGVGVIIVAILVIRLIGSLKPQKEPEPEPMYDQSEFDYDPEDYEL